MTQRNFSKISPHKFKLYPSELKLKEMSRSMKKTQDESNYNYVSNVGSPHLINHGLAVCGSFPWITTIRIAPHYIGIGQMEAIKPRQPVLRPGIS